MDPQNTRKELSPIMYCIGIKVKVLSLNWLFAKSFLTQRLMLAVNSIIFINTQHSNVGSYRSFCNTMRTLGVLEKKETY